MLYGLEIYVKDIVSPHAYKLIVALCAAYQIVADRRLVHHEYWLDAARRLFDTFVRQARIIFGKQFISLNVHLFLTLLTTPNVSEQSKKIPVSNLRTP